MLRGLAKIEQASREIASISGNGGWVQTLRIKDGDSAFIRFLTDKDDLIRAKFHDVKKTTSKGEISIPVYCTREDTEVCSNCSVNLVAYNTINLWAWVYYILHKNQNPNIQSGSDEGIWTQLKTKGGIVFKEEVNAPTWFRTKFGYQGRYKELFVKYADKYGTLIDRDYVWSRKGGTAKNTNYDLDDKKETPMAPEIKKVIVTLPDLGDVICGKVRVFSQGNAENKDTDSKDSEENVELF